MNKINQNINRRSFIKAGTLTGLYIATTAYGQMLTSCNSEKPVRLGFVGVGGRGIRMLKTALSIEGVEVVAISDIIEDKVSRAQQLVTQSGQAKPIGYTGVEDYKKMADLTNLDAIYTATPFELHTPVMLAAMKGGKFGATEMPACFEYDEAWELVETSEKTGIPCMLMENYAYMRNVKMVQTMNQLGLFGDINHCECGYQHDSRYASFGPNGEMLWRAYRGNENGNPYPTHAIGPVAQWIDINRGNKFEYLVSMSSRALGQKYYAKNKFGPDHPGANTNYIQGDVNTSLIQTHNGITVTLYYDTKTPRPIDWIYRVQGTKGIYSGTLNKIYLEDSSPIPHQWEDINSYLEKYDHPLWKKYHSQAFNSGHEGSDYLCMRDFIEAVRKGEESPIDVYDAATWSIISKLTQESVANKSRPVDFPDFTQGKWKNRKPINYV